MVLNIVPNGLGLGEVVEKFLFKSLFFVNLHVLRHFNEHKISVFFIKMRKVFKSFGDYCFFKDCINQQIYTVFKKAGIVFELIFYKISQRFDFVIFLD